MVGIVLDVLVAVKTVEAQRITETLRILANGMTLHQFVDHFGVALNNPLHQSVVLLLGGFGGQEQRVFLITDGNGCGSFVIHTQTFVKVLLLETESKKCFLYLPRHY